MNLKLLLLSILLLFSGFRSYGQSLELEKFEAQHVFSYPTFYLNNGSAFLEGNSVGKKQITYISPNGEYTYFGKELEMSVYREWEPRIVRFVSFNNRMYGIGQFDAAGVRHFVIQEFDPDNSSFDGEVNLLLQGKFRGGGQQYLYRSDFEFIVSPDKKHIALLHILGQTSKGQSNVLNYVFYDANFEKEFERQIIFPDGFFRKDLEGAFEIDQCVIDNSGNLYVTGNLLKKTDVYERGFKVLHFNKDEQQDMVSSVIYDASLTYLPADYHLSVLGSNRFLLAAHGLNFSKLRGKSLGVESRIYLTEMNSFKPEINLDTEDPFEIEWNVDIPLDWNFKVNVFDQKDGPIISVVNYRERYDYNTNAQGDYSPVHRLWAEETLLLALDLNYVETDRILLSHVIAGHARFMVASEGLLLDYREERPPLPYAMTHTNEGIDIYKLSFDSVADHKLVDIISLRKGDFETSTWVPETPEDLPPIQSENPVSKNCVFEVKPNKIGKNATINVLRFR